MASLEYHDSVSALHRRLYRYAKELRQRVVSLGQDSCTSRSPTLRLLYSSITPTEVDCVE